MRVEKANSQAIFPIRSPLGPAGAGGASGGESVWRVEGFPGCGRLPSLGKTDRSCASDRRLLARFDCVGDLYDFSHLGQDVWCIVFSLDVGHISVTAMIVLFLWELLVATWRPPWDFLLPGRPLCP